MRFERKRLGVSELLGTLTMIAITLVAAAVVVGWVNGQAQVSEGQFGQGVAKNVNYLNEHFVLLNVQFLDNSGGGYNQVNVTLYNNGAVGLTIVQISLVNATSTWNGSPSPLSVVENQTMTVASSGTSSGKCNTKDLSDAQLYRLPTTTVNVGSAPATYALTLPGCVANFLHSGESYTIQVLGEYGNLLTTQVTAGG